MSSEQDCLIMFPPTLTLFGRNIGVLQTTVAELVTVKEHQGMSSQSHNEPMESH